MSNTYKSERQHVFRVYSYDEIKHLHEIDKYFEINAKGNWENKIILVEKKLPPKDLVKKFIFYRWVKKNIEQKLF
mgnify:CR=1 FL=1